MTSKLNERGDVLQFLADVFQDRLKGHSPGIPLEVRIRAAAAFAPYRYPYRKKLLVIIPAHMSSPETTAAQSSNILARYVSEDCFRVTVLKGTGDEPMLDQDLETMKSVIAQLVDISSL